MVNLWRKYTTCQSGEFWMILTCYNAQALVQYESKHDHCLCFHNLSPSGATLSMRSLVKEEPDWRTGIMAGDRAGMVGGPLRLRRGSRFTWRKECQSIMERWAGRSRDELGLQASSLNELINLLVYKLSGRSNKSLFFTSTHCFIWPTAWNPNIYSHIR